MTKEKLNELILKISDKTIKDNAVNIGSALLKNTDLSNFKNFSNEEMFKQFTIMIAEATNIGINFSISFILELLEHLQIIVPENISADKLESALNLKVIK